MLAELQARFAAGLVDEGKRDDLSMPLSRPRGLSIYRANVLGAWIRTLALAHPATRVALGSDRFEAAARTFVRAAPPARPELNAYGSGFAPFLSGRGDGPDWLADLAAFEFTLHRSYFAQDENTLDPARLAGLGAAEMRRLFLRPQAALRLIASDHPLVALHAHLLRDGPIPSGGRSWTLVWRAGPDVRFRACGCGEAAMLAALIARHPLVAAARQGADADSGFDVQAALSRHFCDGLYRAAELGEDLA